MKSLKKHLTQSFLIILLVALIKPIQSFSQYRPFLLDSSRAYVSSAQSDQNELGLEEEVTIVLSNYTALLKENPDDLEKLILYINDLPINDIKPVIFSIDSFHLGLRFFVIHEEGPNGVWEQLLLTRPKGQFFKRQVKLSVGYPNQMPLQTLVKEENSFTVVMVRKNWFYMCIAVLIILLIVLIVISAKTDLLRDSVPPPPEGKRRPFSLARTQMAIWFFVIMASWLLLYVVKHNLNTIPDSIVVLMGISAGTGIGSVAIDSKNKGLIRTSHGFFNDLLQEDTGVSFHRFQMLCWTIVIVMVFIRQVSLYLFMPELNTSLLVLMGISSGTYLGFKAGEKPKGE